jgi:hypothetical protein
MKLYRLALLASLLPLAAYAQQGTNVSPGQLPQGASVNQTYYLQNTDPTGFSETAEAGNGTLIAGTGTTQAGATLLTARTNMVNCVTGATALQLPAVQRYTSISILNRGTAACLIFPPTGNYVESAAGTVAAVNASASLAAGADAVFRPYITASTATPASAVVFAQ